MAVNSLSGLPNSFTSRISDFATEFEVEYTVVGAVDDGLTDVEKIRERVLSNVRVLTKGQVDAVDDAIAQLVEKQILERHGEDVQVE